MRLSALIGLPALLMGPAIADAADDALEEVVVTASRSERSLLEVPASVASQSMEQMRDLGFTYGGEEFRGIPGVFVRRGEGDGDEFPFVSIRGSSGTEGYIALIDSVPFLGPDEEPVLNQVPYDALERIEVVKGPVSALYGRGGLYGAVNYITRLPRANGTSLALTAGEDDYYRGEATFNRVFTGGKALLSAAYENYGGWREQSHKRVLNLFGRASFDLTPQTTLDVSVNYFDRNSEVPNAVPTTPGGEVLPVFGGARHFLGYGDPRNLTEGLIGSARITYAPSEVLSTSLVVQARRYDQTLNLNFYDPYGLDLDRHLVGFNGFASDKRQDVYFTEGTVSYHRGAHTLVAGVSGERSRSRGISYWSGVNGFTEECDYNFYLIQFDYTTGANVSAGHPCFAVNDPVTGDRFTNTFWGAFLQDEIQLADRWRLTLGGRYDSFERQAHVASPPDQPYAQLSGKASAFSPKASISWLYGTGQVYFTYGRGFNSNFGTTFEWDAALYARPENKPSKLDSYELGWKARALQDRLQFEAAVFYTEQTNRRLFLPNPDVEFDPTAPGTRIAFGSLYRSQGVEAALQWQPWAGGNLTVQYSFLDPKWKDYVVQSSFAPPLDLSGTTPTGVARHIYYLGAEQQFTPALKGYAHLQIYGDYQITQINSLHGGGYTLLDLGATIEPQRWGKVSLNLSLANALDERYYFRFGGRSAATTAIPGVPRQLRATLRANF
ncbi:MAG: TonB-dependent receptor [Steroidobacteraceae bacterium]